MGKPKVAFMPGSDRVIPCRLDQGLLPILSKGRSAVLADAHRNQDRRHQAAAAVVVIGIESKPQHIAQKPESKSREEKFCHAGPSLTNTIAAL